MMRSLLLSFMFVALPQSTLPAEPPPQSTLKPAKAPLPEPTWIVVKPLRESLFPRASKLLADVDRFLDEHGIGQVRDLMHLPDTYAHESSHMVSSTIRNRFGGRVNAFYVGNGKALVIKEPRTTIQRVAGFVPERFRKSRFQTYLVSQAQSWSDRPLYLVDEWNAYTMGAAVSLCQAEEGLHFEKRTDASVGQVEFIPYVLALHLAIEKDDPDYLTSKDGEQFRRFTAWNIRRAEKQYHACQKVSGLEWEHEFDLSHSSAKELKRVYDSLLSGSSVSVVAAAKPADKPKPPQSTVGERIPVKPVVLEYSDAYRLAVAQNRKLLVYVGCEPCHSPTGFIVVRWDDFPLAAGGVACIVSEPFEERMTWTETIVNPTADSVKKTLERLYDRKAVKPTAIPFPQDRQNATPDRRDVKLPVGSVEALGEVNAARSARGLKPFIYDEKLTVAAAGAAKFRADNRISGHTQNDFDYVPSGGSATAAGCAAWPPELGWGSCCCYEDWTYAGAAYAIGSDGQRYMHLFVK